MSQIKIPANCLITVIRDVMTEIICRRQSGLKHPSDLTWDIRYGMSHVRTSPYLGKELADKGEEGLAVAKGKNPTILPFD